MSKSKLIGLVFSMLSLSVEAAEVPPAVLNTQPETHPMLAPEDALAQLKLPPGFYSTVFASEPDVRQPIALAFDSRGRMWVAENDTYADRATDYDLTQSDRIVIFEDADHDGKAESRKIFWDQGHHLTSVELGFGGVWVLCAPDLLFIPDRNHDDVPDGEPIVMLTGFNNSSIRHNIVNGLKWGPDGWLYGRQGITTTSFVGTPETPEELRTPLNCSMWRFHPVTRKFEVVSHGTTNSWGHDWDKHGELFFINTVIGHFWHVVPGVHLERMFGEDFNPHLYRLMPQAADHYHWDRSEKWSDIRNTGVTTTTDEAGGGHAHCGMMIYQGTRWPENLRDSVFTLNLHGRRINRDVIERHEAGFVGQHRPDFAKSGDLWFRGVELAQGPDGNVFILDWSDIGECHENDGIHRTSGRIYRISYGNAGSLVSNDFRKFSTAELFLQLQSEDAWQHRMARRILQERYVAGDDLKSLREQCNTLLFGNGPVTNRLHALWALHSTGGVAEADLKQLLNSDHEALRVWAIEFLAQGDLPERHESTFRELAAKDPSGLVLLHLASALQRLPLEHRLAIGAALLKRDEFANDRHLPLMIWYGIEPSVNAYPRQAFELISTCRMPEIIKFISRRVTSEYRERRDVVGELVGILATLDDVAAIQILTGMQDALAGWRRADAPNGWQELGEKLAVKENSDLQQLFRELSVTFGDGRALDELRAVAANVNEEVSKRRNAVRGLVTAQDADSRELLIKLLNDRELAVDAIRGLAVLGDEQTPQLIVDNYGRFRGHIRPVAIETLAARPESAVVLLDAVAQKKIAVEELPPFYVRQMRSFSDDRVQQKLKLLFPEWRHTSEEKEHRVKELRALLTEQALSSANASRGRVLFEKTCASCHKLYGAGGKLGPDLTGSQRTNLNYLLGNIVDPSAEVAEKYQMSIIVLTDGRVVSGVVQQESDATLVVLTPNEELTLLQEDIAARKNSKLSMMPERQLDKMNTEEVIDLFAYLMSTQQVP